MREMTDRQGRLIEDLEAPRAPRLSRRNPRGSWRGWLLLLGLCCVVWLLLWGCRAEDARISIESTTHYLPDGTYVRVEVDWTEQRCRVSIHEAHQGTTVAQFPGYAVFCPVGKGLKTSLAIQYAVPPVWPDEAPTIRPAVAERESDL